MKGQNKNRERSIRPKITIFPTNKGFIAFLVISLIGICILGKSFKQKNKKIIENLEKKSVWKEPDAPSLELPEKKTKEKDELFSNFTSEQKKELKIENLTFFHENNINDVVESKDPSHVRILLKTLSKSKNIQKKVKLAEKVISQTVSEDKPLALSTVFWLSKF